MIRTFFFTLLLSLPLSAVASTLYTVELTIYMDKKALNTALSKFPPALHKTIVIEKNNDKFHIKTLLTKDKKLLTTLLPSYQKVFSDAFIDTFTPPVTVVKKPVKLPKKVTQEQNTTKEESTFNALLQNKTFYLSPVLKVGENKKFLITVTFTDSNVTYTPILGKVPPMTALYKVEDNKLFLYQKGLFNPKVYSQLEKNTFKYHLISSWIDNQRVKNLRYYLNLHDAKAYLNSL